MAESLEQFYERLLTRVGNLALRTVRPMIPSQTLQDSLVLEIGIDLLAPRAVLFIPHYWAVYLHDGRGVVTPDEKTWLVWFHNPQDDPRTSGGADYPVRAADIRRLTPEEWAEGLERNAEARAAGLPPYMIVTKLAGPVEFPMSFEWFEAGMSGFSSLAAPIVLEEFDRYVRSLHKPKTDTARLTIKL